MLLVISPSNHSTQLNPFDVNLNLKHVLYHKLGMIDYLGLSRNNHPRLRLAIQYLQISLQIKLGHSFIDRSVNFEFRPLIIHPYSHP